MNWQAKSSKNIQLPISWQQLQHGHEYCNVISQYFANWFPKILGYQILKIGGLSAEIKCDLPLRHQIIIAPKIDEDLMSFPSPSESSLIQALPTKLPFVQQSIDACLLAQTINFSQDPHQLLREIHRVLSDDGYLFLSLFNPLSKLICKRHLHKKNNKKLIFRHFLIWRVIDWLELLHFEILVQQNLPTSFFSPLTVIVARKRAYSLLLASPKMKFKSHDLFRPAEMFLSYYKNYP